MRTARTYAARAAWLLILLAVSACSGLEALAPPPLETAFSPLPAPPPPEPPPQTPPAPQRTAPPSPEAARAEITRWLATSGYKDYQISALLGHARDESNFNACITGPGGLRYLFQWGGTRLEQLQKFAHTSGCPQIHTQLAFADKELRHDPKFSCFWGAHTASDAYAALRRGFGHGAC
jgi:hypothetical protein